MTAFIWTSLIMHILGARQNFTFFAKTGNPVFIFSAMFNIAIIVWAGFLLWG